MRSCNHTVDHGFDKVGTIFSCPSHCIACAGGVVGVLLQRYISFPCSISICSMNCMNFSSSRCSVSISCSSTDAVAGLRQFSANQNSQWLTPYAVGRLACGLFCSTPDSPPAGAGALHSQWQFALGVTLSATFI